MIQDTSKQAYAAYAPKIGHKQRVVLDVIESGNGMTNSEIASALHMPINTITPRVHELRKIGKVKEAGKRPCHITGKTAYCWVAYQKGTLF